MKKLLVDIWNCLFDCYLTVRNSLYLFMDIPYRKVVIAPHVVSIEETIRYIIQSHCSVSRLGDGEIKIANGKALAFQTQQPSQSIAHYIELFKSVFHKECTSKVFGLTFGGTSTFNTLFFRDDFKPINAEKDCFCHE